MRVLDCLIRGEDLALLTDVSVSNHDTANALVTDAFLARDRVPGGFVLRLPWCQAELEVARVLGKILLGGHACVFSVTFTIGSQLLRLR